jgi:hypothetical protein
LLQTWFPLALSGNSGSILTPCLPGTRRRRKVSKLVKWLLAILVQLEKTTRGRRRQSRTCISEKRETKDERKTRDDPPLLDC